MNTTTRAILQTVMTSDASLTEPERGFVRRLLDGDFGEAATPGATAGERLLVTQKRAAELLSVNRVTIWRMTRDGMLHPVEILPGMLRYPLNEIARLAQRGAAAESLARGKPSAHGLARVLNAAIRADPKRYAAAAESLVGLQSVYVTTYLAVFAELAHGKMEFEIAPLLKLGRWVVEQPDPLTDVADDLGHSHRGRQWSSARSNLARILDHVLERVPSAGDFGHRERIWPLVAALLKDESPTNADEWKSDEIPDWSFLSYNTIRGRATHALCEYVGWVRQGKGASDAFTLKADAPEAKAELERLLRADSPTCRITIARHLSRFFSWDRMWVGEIRTLLFQQSNPDVWAATWHDFLATTRPARVVVENLYAEFRAAVQDINKLDRGSRQRSAAAELGQYLVDGYVLGFVKGPADDKGGLLDTFFERANDELRAAAIARVGHFLDRSAEVPAPVVERVQRLWEWRLNVAQGAKSGSFSKEIAAFAWWFDSGRLPSDWAAAQMVSALEYARPTEAHTLWLERFAVDAPKHLLESVKALDLTLSACLDTGQPFFGDEEAMRILKNVESASGGELLEVAKRVQNRLVQSGRSQFRNLFRPSGEPRADRPDGPKTTS